MPTQLSAHSMTQKLMINEMEKILVLINAKFKNKTHAIGALTN